MKLLLCDLSVSIGRRTVVHRVSAAVAGGEVAVLLGRNGAGKTTLIRGLAGLLPTTGKIMLGDVDLATLAPSPRSRLTGYMAQDLASAATRLSVLELLLLAQNGDRVSWQATPGSLERAGAVLDMLRLEPLATSLPGELSGGQRQLVHLALALVRRPRLLLLDEPTSALDLANQLHLLATVGDYTRREGIVTVLILHDLSLAARFADTVIMLDSGAVAHAGPSRTVINETVIGSVYGVSCRVLPVEGDLRAVYPLAPLA